jgi:tetratricopeptide (TPR) repeat protein
MRDAAGARADFLRPAAAGKFLRRDAFMFRNPIHVGEASRTSLTLRVALAVVLGSGLVLGGTAPAFAKDKPQETKAEGNSKAFVQAYAPMQAIINNPAGDFASAKAMVPTVQASIQNNADKNTLGLALISLGTKTNDPALQKQGLQLALDSGLSTPAQVGAFHFFLGKFDYDAKDYANARSQFQAALQAGYTDNDPRPAIAETYFQSGQQAQGLSYLSGVIKQQRAAGKAVPSAWLLRGLQVAYQAKLPQQANEYAEELVASDPSPKNWQAALQVVNAIDSLDANGQLDLLRLMRQTGALKDQRDYQAYIDEADPMKLSTEVLAVIDEGIKSGVLSASDANLQKSKSVAQSREAANKAAAGSIAQDARKATTSKLGVVAGDQYLSLGDYATAAEMYKLAVDKGGDDASLAQVRLGIAQVKQGQLDAAKASFGKVTGARAPVAQMWLAYIASKSAPATPAAPAAPANGA